ncbi:MAG: Flp pilus assembly complex ATPase component TadA [Phycisphaerales bacterium]|nr:Flp pilus assembly complex ATPase component TadA [Phycisphaerales bacterium]
MFESLQIMPIGTLTLGSETFVLVSWWKPLLLIAPFIGWAWVVSKSLDKHAQRFFLGREKWALIHMIFAMVALAMFRIPIGGIAGFAAAFFGIIVILALDILLFAGITNRDHRVPEGSKLVLNMKDAAAKRDARKLAKSLGSSELIIVGASKMTIPPPGKESPDLPVRVAAEHLLIKGFTMHASQIDFLPASESTYAASYLVDGVRQAGDPLPKADANQIIDFWKKCAGLDLKDRRRKLHGQVSVNGSGMTGVDVKLVSSGSKSGMKMSMIFNPTQAVRRKPADLGLFDKQLDLLKGWASDTTGVVLLASPSDNGRTTSLYSILRLHDAYTSNIQTIEMEIEDPLEGIKQIEFDVSADGPDFATTVRSTLRRDPDVVGIVELPDTETALNIANSDLDRSRVYLSLKTDSALGAIQIYTKAVGDPKLAGKGLRGVVASKLVRVLCSNCKVPYAPTPDMLKKLGLPEDKVSQLFKKGGQVLVRNKPEVCSVCNGIGYIGQTGCFGVFVIENEERVLIAEENWTALRSAMRKRGLPSVQQSALRKAVDGMTSIEEVTRITASKPRKSSSKPKASAS